MRLFVTGAAGFLGRRVVAHALARGHDTVALIRKGDLDAPGVIVVRGDLRQPAGWRHHLAGVDAVVHLAMGTGSFSEQFAGTVIATESLLAAMRAAGVDRLVHASTFSLYDYAALPVGTVLDERSPIEAHPLRRDDYLRTKLVQEQLVNEFADAGGKVTSLRPGAIYDDTHVWDGGFGLVVGSVGLAIAPGALMKLTHVDNCAEAMVLAAERPASIGEVINVVDDDLPTQRAFAAGLARAGHTMPRAVPVPYRLGLLLARLAWKVNERLLDGGAKLPALLNPYRFDALFKPLSYSNEKAKRVLGWDPKAQT